MTPARPTVDVDGLAELLAAHVRLTSMDFPFACSCDPYTQDSTGPHHKHVAAVIAAHLAAVTAERDEARAAVDRVRIVQAKYAERSTWKGFEGPRRVAWKEASDDLRAALDHVPTTEGGEG